MLACKLALLERLRRNGVPVEAVVFCRGSDIPDPRVRVLASVADLLLDPFFKSADLHSFEFGVQDHLFDFGLRAASRRRLARHLSQHHPAGPVAEDQRQQVMNSFGERQSVRDRSRRLRERVQPPRLAGHRLPGRADERRALPHARDAGRDACPPSSRTASRAGRIPVRRPPGPAPRAWSSCWRRRTNSPRKACPHSG